MKHEKITYEIHSRIHDQTNVQTSQVIGPMVTQIENQIRRQADEMWVHLQEQLMLLTRSEVNVQVSREVYLTFMQ